MKLAIPLWEDKIAPFFGAASRVLVITIRDGRVEGESYLRLKGKSPIETASHLANLGVDGVLCGGIQSYCKEWLADRGVAVFDNRVGDADEIIRVFCTLGESGI